MCKSPVCWQERNYFHWSKEEKKRYCDVLLVVLCHNQTSPYPLLSALSTCSFIRGFVRLYQLNNFSNHFFVSRAFNGFLFWGSINENFPFVFNGCTSSHYSCCICTYIWSLLLPSKLIYFLLKELLLYSTLFLQVMIPTIIIIPDFTVMYGCMIPF